MLRCTGEKHPATGKRITDIPQISFILGTHRLLEEEFQKREELERLQAQQEELLRAEREQNKVLEGDRRAQETLLADAKARLQELELERLAAEEKMQVGGEIFDF